MWFFLLLTVRPKQTLSTIIEENSGGPPVSALVADASQRPSLDMSSNSDMIDDTQGLDICRVCRSEGLPDRPLFHPCICTGSIKWIHQECLIQWMRYSRKVCNTTDYKIFLILFCFLLCNNGFSFTLFRSTANCAVIDFHLLPFIHRICLVDFHFEMLLVVYSQVLPRQCIIGYIPP